MSKGASLEGWSTSESFRWRFANEQFLQDISNFFRNLKDQEIVTLNLGHASSDGISSNTSTQKYSKATSKIETYKDSSEEIPTDLLN